jgi:prefoldin subunit 5
MKLLSSRRTLPALVAVLILGGSVPVAASAQTPSVESLRAQLEQLTRSVESLRSTAAAPAAPLTQAATAKPVVPVRPTCRVGLDKTVYVLGERVKITVGATAATRVEFIDGIEQIQGTGKTLPSLGKNGGNVTLASAKTLTDEEGYEYGARGAVVRVRATSVTGHTAECSKALAFVYEDATKKDAQLEALWIKVNDVYRALDALEERRAAMNDQENKFHTVLDNLYTQMREVRQRGNVNLVGLELDLVEQSTSSALFEFEFIFENKTRKAVGLNEASFDLVAINRRAGHVSEGVIDIESVTFAGGEAGAVVNPGMQEEATVRARYTPRAGRQGQFTLWIDDITYYTNPPTNTDDMEVMWEFDHIETPYAVFRNAVKG